MTLHRFVPCGFFLNGASNDRRFSKNYFFISYAIVNLLIIDLVLHVFLHALRKRVKGFDGIFLAKDLITEDELYEELSNTLLVKCLNIMIFVMQRLITTYF